VPTVWKKPVFTVVLTQATVVLTVNRITGLRTSIHVRIATSSRLEMEVEAPKEVIVNHLQDLIVISALFLFVVLCLKPL
jgi:hypothetical protein